MNARTIQCPSSAGGPTVTFDLSELLGESGAVQFKKDGPAGQDFVYYLNLAGLPDVARSDGSCCNSFDICNPVPPTGSFNPWNNVQIAAQAEKSQGGLCYPLGALSDVTDSSKWSYDATTQNMDGNNVIGTGTVTISQVAANPSDDSSRKVNVDLICSKEACSPYVVSVGEDTTPGTYDWTIHTIEACDPSEYSKSSNCKTSKNSGAETGWILTSLALSGVFVYVAGGFLYNTKKLGKEGSERWLHYDFWSSIPGLIKEGVRFSAHKTKQLFSKEAAEDYTPL